MVEYQIVALKVMGSSPIIRPKTCIEKRKRRTWIFSYNNMKRLGNRFTK
jgi:hypothetical protein